MGINVNNLVVKGNEPTKETSVSYAPKPIVKHTPTIDTKGTKLVVDGKVKNISKKSAFLLDMLSLDDE